MNIVILMATYNGEKYITEQLKSIQNQTVVNWNLYIRDDGSVDNTVSIIKKYVEKDSRIHLIEDGKGNLGPLKNFNELLNIGINSDIIFLADQDDIWFLNKIEISVEELTKIENPLKLIYTNFNNWYPEKKLQIKNYKQSNPDYKNLVWQNWIYGCTMCFSKELALLCLEIPLVAENHDNWIANVASLYGEIGYISSPTLNHRIHDNNVTTSSENLLGQYFKLLKRTLFSKDKFKKNKLSFIKKLIQIDEETSKKNVDIILAKKIIDEGGFISVYRFKKNNFQAYSRLQSLLILLCII